MGYTASVLRKRACRFISGLIGDLAVENTSVQCIIPVGPCTRCPPRDQKGGQLSWHPKPKMLLMLPQVYFFLRDPIFGGWFQAMPASRPPWAPGCRCVPRAPSWKMGSWGADGKVFAVPQKTPKTSFGFLSCFRFLLLLYLSICRLMYHYWLISPMIFHTVFPYRTPEEDSQGGFYHDF